MKEIKTAADVRRNRKSRVAEILAGHKPPGSVPWKTERVRRLARQVDTVHRRLIKLAAAAEFDGLASESAQLMKAAVRLSLLASSIDGTASKLKQRPWGWDGAGRQR